MSKLDKLEIIELPIAVACYLICTRKYEIIYGLYEGGEFVHNFLDYWLNRNSNE